MEKEILEIINKFYIEELNKLSKYQRVYAVTKLKLRLNHYGEIKN